MGPSLFTSSRTEGLPLVLGQWEPVPHLELWCGMRELPGSTSLYLCVLGFPERRCFCAASRFHCRAGFDCREGRGAPHPSLGHRGLCRAPWWHCRGARRHHLPGEREEPFLPGVVPPGSSPGRPRAAAGPRQSPPSPRLCAGTAGAPGSGSTSRSPNLGQPRQQRPLGRFVSSVPTSSTGLRARGVPAGMDPTALLGNLCLGWDHRAWRLGIAEPQNRLCWKP